MSNSRARSSRVFTISFPEPLARQVEETAREEHRNISELFREAWRAYKLQALERRLESLRPKLTREEAALTEEQIQDLVARYVHEVRTEMYEQRKARS
jgi:metal-responsive CopG/Arc/MetJ family transcriptional regulator